MDDDDDDDSDDDDSQQSLECVQIIEAKRGKVWRRISYIYIYIQRMCTPSPSMYVYIYAINEHTLAMYLTILYTYTYYYQQMIIDISFEVCTVCCRIHILFYIIHMYMYDEAANKRSIFVLLCGRCAPVTVPKPMHRSM